MNMCKNNKAPEVEKTDSFSDSTTTSETTKNTTITATTTSPTNTNSITMKAIYTILWIILTYTSKEFAKFLSIYQSQAAQKTFIPASYQYDDENTYFDNTFLTYGTDYMLCALMTYASYKCYSTKTGLGYKGCALFACYAISVLCGGYAHQTFFGVDDLNTRSFRIWWIVCVGTVTGAGGFMGMCGSEICNFFQDNVYERSDGRVMVFEKRFKFGNVHHALWWYYGGFLTFVCIMGEISYKRPACDIFVAGTSQFVPTVYIELTLLCMRWRDAIPGVEGRSKEATTATTTSNQYSYLAISRKLRILLYLGFFLNAPLLPSYPLLVQYTNLSLGVVNALMHANLTIAWGMQAWSIYHVCLAMNNFKKGLVGMGDDTAVGMAGGGKKYL